MPSQNGAKSSSRFHSLNVFKLKSPSNVAPPLPPKDGPPYTKSLFSRSAVSLSPSLSSGPATPATPFLSAGFEFGKLPNGVSPPSANGWGTPAFPSPATADYLSTASPSASTSADGTDSSGSCPNPNRGVYQLSDANASSYTMSQASTSGTRSKKGVFKLASLAKRNKSKKDLSDTTSASGSAGWSTSEREDSPGNVEGDEGISLPWNFQHNIHVDEGYIGLPPSWSAALSEVGFDDDEIAAIHSRRQVAVATALASSPKLPDSRAIDSTERPPVIPLTSASASSTSGSSVLLQPVPRSTSLGKGRGVLVIQSPPTPAGSGTSPGPSPRAPSFSMKTFVSGIKSSLSTDSTNWNEDANSSRGGEGVVGEESDQYIFVDGDGPGEGRDQGMGDEKFIDPYPFDASSASSHTSQTPRIPTFPQIQVQRTRSDSGHVPFPSSAPRAPSPLVHSTSLPTPVPPHGYAFSNHSISPSPPHSLSVASPRPGPVSTSSQPPARRVYHVVNASSDSLDGEKYAEPPPAYVSPQKEDSVQTREKEDFRFSSGPPPPNRPIPPIPSDQTLGQPSIINGHSNGEQDREASTFENSTDSTVLSAGHIPGTAEEVLDTYYSDIPIHEDAEIDSAQHTRISSQTPPLVIDKRLSKLAALPPRISFHQEGSLEDWSESLFSVIGSKGKRSSVMVGPKGGNVAIAKGRGTSVRSITPLSVTNENQAVPAMGSHPLPPEPLTPALPDISFGANLTLGTHSKNGTVDTTEEGNQEKQAEETEPLVTDTEGAPEDDAEAQVSTSVDAATTADEEVKQIDTSQVAPLVPLPPDVSLGPNTSSLGKDLGPVESTSESSLPSESPCGASEDSPPPRPPPKTKPKSIPPALPRTAAFAPPRTNVITGISGKSPVNPLFGAKPQPLPIPIPLSQIRTQLRPAPPKPPHPPPALPLPPLKRPQSQLNLHPSSPPRSPLPPVPSPHRAFRHDSAPSPVSLFDSRPNSSQTLTPSRVNPSDRDSGMSTITVTPATIATAKTEVVRTAVASVVDSDAVSLASRGESAIPAANTESQGLADGAPDKEGESPPTQEHGEVTDDSMVSESSSVSLLRDGPQSKWPAPPPPPVELGTDSTPHRLSRFRTTSLGRVTQLQAMGSGTASPMGSHSSRGSSDTISSSTSESVPLTTPKGINGVVLSAASKLTGGLAVEARLLSSTMDTFGGADVESDGDGEEAEVIHSDSPPEAPSSESNATMPPTTHPLLVQLHPYIATRNPSSSFTNLVEIAEGESGSVFAARILPSFAAGLQRSTEKPIPSGTSLVAIKRIPLPPATSSPSDNSPVANKLVSLLHELSLLKNLEHEHLLLLDAVYVGSNSSQIKNTEDASAVDTSLWIRMELMERSLADVIGLVAEGLVIQERLVGRFASDILQGLDYLQRQHIAHRDVRSDNLLVNATGVVKLADFSNAIRVDRNAPVVSGAVGVIYWQAPEMRAGPYNALKVDVWSLGATVWELAETVPPFSMPTSSSTQGQFAIQNSWQVGSQWPPLSHPKHYSRAFHDFLRLCGRESAGRPEPGELLNTPFIRNACGRAVILQLLSQCRAIEEGMASSSSVTGPS